MRSLDRFDDLTPWRLEASDDVKASLRQSDDGTGGRAMCVDFDFGRVSGYAAVRRSLPLEYGKNYEFSLEVRGDAPPNGLQLTLADATGESVWWVNRPEFVFSREWQQLRFTARDVQFAWGPAADRTLRQSASLGLVIARGRGGGRGTVCFRRLAFRDLPPARDESGSASHPPVFTASSALPSAEAARAFDGRTDTAWRSDPTAGPEQFLTVDFTEPHELGGLILHWLPDMFARRYTVELSDDGAQWRTVLRVTDANGGTDPILLGGARARYLRLRLQDGPARAYGLSEVELKDASFGASPNAFFQAIAKQAPRGHYPRAFSGEQSYWTVVGVDGGSAKALLSEDGAVELGAERPSVEPFLLSGDSLVTWADVQVEHSLLDGYLPLPSVIWNHGDWTLSVTAFGTGERARNQLIADYAIRNTTDRTLALTFVLAVRPFQVNPPTQFLNVQGGVAPIKQLKWDGKALGINGEQRVFPLTRPDELIVADFAAGSLPRLLARRQQEQLPARQMPSQQRPAPQAEVTDETGFASAALIYRLQLPPHGVRRVGLVAPLDGAPELPSADSETWRERLRQRVAQEWRAKLNHVALELPQAGRPLTDTLRSALAQILLSRSGPALQPGTRAYARSWVRDGAMMADALHRLGHSAVSREFVDWFTPHQFSSGKVPCCVDWRGADPVVENDSPGELIHMIAAQYRYSPDRAWLEKMWPHVAAAVGYMDGLREKERTPQNLAVERRAFYGLLPPSISHEGYSDRPAYSYWDDFWGMAGYAAAVDIATALGKADDARRFAAARDQFTQDVHQSLASAMAAHHLDDLPASADRGDFDPTSTTIGLTVAGDQAGLPQQALERTYERYWKAFVDRRDGKVSWDAYTPYELRNVGAFVRLGWRARAQELLEFFMAGRRPASWNQWAEVVGRDSREPRFIGDMPHGWVASDFIQAVLDMFAYERGDRALVLGAGVPVAWLQGAGIGVRSLRTPYGELSYTLRQDADRMRLELRSGITVPSAGLVFRWPYETPPGRTSINGKAAQWSQGGELHIHAAPASVDIELPPHPR